MLAAPLVCRNFWAQQACAPRFISDFKFFRANPERDNHIAIRFSIMLAFHRAAELQAAILSSGLNLMNLIWQLKFYLS
jgi:hypothetical protein